MSLLRTSVLCLLLGALLCTASYAKADGMRCHSRLVNVGDPALKLEQRCGPADFVTIQPATVTLTGVNARITGVSVGGVEEVETRVYRGGPGQLTTFVDIRRGTIVATRLVQIFTTDDPVACMKIIDRHDEIGKVRLACGAPVESGQWSEERVVWLNGYQLVQRVNYDRWSYDLGEGRFARILTFENGILASIETSDRHEAAPRW